MGGVIDPITSLTGSVIHQLKSEDTVKAVDLMEEYQLDHEDALHLATALRTDAEGIISNDKDFDKTPLHRAF